MPQRCFSLPQRIKSSRQYRYHLDPTRMRIVSQIVRHAQQQAAPLPAAAALLWRTIDGRICMMSLQLALA